MNYPSKNIQKVSNIAEKQKHLHASLSRSSINDNPIFMIYVNSSKSEKNEKKIKKSIWQVPISNRWKAVWWTYTWPIRVLLMFTVPNPKTYRRMYPLTFIMCILWIGLISYFIVELLEVIGKSILQS